MFKRCSILAVVSLFFLTMIYTVTIAQEKKVNYVYVTGMVKEIDHENGTITTVTKKRDGGTSEETIKVSKQTMYVFVRSIKELESGDFVSIKCKGLKGEYEAVKVKKIKKPKK